jgi:hypothetical protein
MAGALESKNGNSWLTTIVEAMRAEWGVTLKQAVFEESLSAALALWPCMLARHGVEVQFDFGDQARQDGKERMRAWINAHYEISKAQPPPPDFMKRCLPPTLDGSLPPI